MGSHFFFGIDTTIPEPKKCGSGTSSMNGVPCTTCAGASICVVMDTLDLHVLEIGPIRGLVSEAMGQIVEFKPHAVVEILLERHATNFFGHCNSSRDS